MLQVNDLGKCWFLILKSAIGKNTTLAPVDLNDFLCALLKSLYSAPESSKVKPTFQPLE